MLAEASESCSSPEDLAADEQTNWQGSQIKNLSHKLIHITQVPEMLITTEELGSTLDSEAGSSLEQSETINGMTSDRVEDRYADP